MAVTRDVLLEHRLSAAQEALRRGDAGACRREAAAALAMASRKRDRHSAARATLVTSHGLLLESRMGWAHSFAVRAAGLCRNVDDPALEAESLMVVSYTHSALGRHEAATNASSRCIGLAASLRSETASAAGLNYYGVASFWAGQFGTAAGVLEASGLVGKELRRPGLMFQPLTNACFTEVLKIGDAQRRGLEPDHAPLARLVEETRSIRDVEMLASTNAEFGFFLLAFSGCFLAARLGQADEADRQLRACADWCGRLPHGHWMRTLLSWAHLECALLAGQVNEARHQGLRMREAALSCDHESLNALARLVAADVLQRARRPGAPHH